MALPHPHRRDPRRPVARPLRPQRRRPSRGAGEIDEARGSGPVNPRTGVRPYPGSSSSGPALAVPKALEPRDRLELGLINFRYWFPSATGFWRLSGHCAAQGLLAHAAFLLHQATERYFFHAALLIFTGYKPKTHDILKLAAEAAPLHPLLAPVLPRTAPEDGRLTDLLRRAYIEARYSKSYRITTDELATLRTRIRDLALAVHAACLEKLASFCGPSHVPPNLPDVPHPNDIADLPDTPLPDDAPAFEAWRESLIARSYERGREAGEQHGFERGEQHGERKGLIDAILTVLTARGLPLSPSDRARIEACDDPDVLKAWVVRAASADSMESFFSA